MRFTSLLLLVLTGYFGFSQNRDRSDWNDFGSSHINKWLQIAPAALGPNSLPVPFMDYARLDSVSNIEVGAHGHFMDGDKGVNSYLSLYWAVVPKRVVVHIWGYPSETFQTDNAVRDERQIFYDDTGWITQTGDFWISTYIQLVKEQEKWPGISISYSAKTTTGGAIQGRFTDAPANAYYAAFGKSFCPKKGFIDEVRIGLMAGFYVWQTNKVELAQDEGPLYQLGVDLKHRNWSWKNEIGGYNGYDVYQYQYPEVHAANDPLIYKTNLRFAANRFDWKIEYQTGLYDYLYNTFRFSVFYKFGYRKFETD
jgi:hypothetical protein